ncbi:hypothetical protein [Clostridium perfringens]|uniref:hypothetical protein n=1 Tax=Clostridium perfringens TaxID=1502 RepID=UPI000D714944|nr:hypothetical protein [Clostridium perfringens]MDK0690096.1 hypothetical protein [Clostridium perfringens]MDK0888079.1 hypothetical protein [Clostridium perfringens]MDM0746492.1 hypothetical protein [Clostridium perfringens]MDM0749386.1 hypothetical protein [Clostridium perfringens]MDM0787036.1 hypothetical protein [Clostridium perfringens]
MLDKLIEEGKTFDGKFTTEYAYTSGLGIQEDLKSSYLRWISKVGTYAEGKLRGKYPEMTKEIIQIVKSRSKEIKDYDIIIGYLEIVKENQQQNKSATRVF